jgi:DNA-binding beta-propeller fold protein YncE
VAIRFRDDGNLEVCDAGRKQMFVLSPDGKLVSAISGAMLTARRDSGSDDPVFKPVASCPGPNGTSAVLNAAAHRIEVIDALSGEVVGAWSGPGSSEGRLFVPVAMAASTDGLVVSDLMNRRLQRFNTEGEATGVVSKPGGAPGYLAHPKGVAVDDNGVIYVVDAAMHIVQMFDTNGTFLMSFGGPEPEQGGLIAPAGICIDRSALPHFAKYVRPGFAADHLIFVANQIGPSRISVYAFGHGPTTPATGS